MSAGAALLDAMVFAVPERGGRLPGRQLRAARAFAAWIAIASATALLAAPAAPPAPGASGPGWVLIVRSSSLKPYKAVEQAFTDSVGRPTRTLSLADGDGPDKVAEAIASGASLVFVVGKEAARKVTGLRVAVPIMYALVPDPAEAGLERDAPGISMYVSPADQLEAIRSALPRARKLGVLFDPAESRELVERCEAAAKLDAFTVIPRAVASREQVAGAARELFQQVDALWLVPDTTVVSADSFRFLVQMSLETKVPLIGFSKGMTQAGALLSVEAAHPAMGRKAADLARRLLAGERPRQESPEGSLTVNTKSAELLGTPVPPALLERATNVSP